VALILLVVWGMDTLGTLRGLKMEYFIYTDPLVVIAAALLLSTLVDLQSHRWVFPVGIVFLALHIGMSQIESVKFTLAKRLPLAFCQPHFHYTKRLEGYSFCPPPRASLYPRGQNSRHALSVLAQGEEGLTFPAVHIFDGP
jgi:hypothetical protein